MSSREDMPWKEEGQKHHPSGFKTKKAMIERSKIVPIEIDRVLEEQYSSKEIKDEFGRTRTYALGVKDIVDILLKLNERKTK